MEQSFEKNIRFLTTFFIKTEFETRFPIENPIWDSIKKVKHIKFEIKNKIATKHAIENRIFDKVSNRKPDLEQSFQ